MEISFTDAVFYEDMYSTTGTGTSTESDAAVWEFGTFTTDGQYKVTLPFQINTNAGVTKIDGLIQSNGETVEAGHFRVAYDDTDKATTITFNSADVGVNSDVQITYQRRVAGGYVTDITSENGSARGSLQLTYQVMSSGDDCTQSAAKALYHVEVPRVMVTQRPTLDTSRGTAATPQVTFTAIDSHRADGRWYRTIYEELSSTGAVSTEYDAANTNPWA